jgi:hypothetical protein
LAKSDSDPLNALPDGIESLVPLEIGHLTIPTTSTWLSLNLAPVNPPQLFTSAILTRFDIDFRDPNSAQGEVRGLLECSVRKQGLRTESVFISGDAFFHAEFLTEPEDSQGHASRNIYDRCLMLALVLSLNEIQDKAFQKGEAPKPQP